MTVKKIMLMIVVLIAGYFVFVRQSDADRRERECKRWSEIDAEELQVCRQSEDGKKRVIDTQISKAKRAFAERHKFALAALFQNPKSTVDEASYVPISVEELMKRLYSSDDASNWLKSRMCRDGVPHPEYGRKFRVDGDIRAVEGTLDKNNRSEPYIYLADPMRGQLDIENLNRFERTFIREHCNSFFNCRSTLFVSINMNCINILFKPSIFVDQVDFHDK